MKTRTVVLGCLLVVLILGAVAAVGLWFVWRSDTVQGGVEAVKSGAGVMSSLAKLEQMDDLDAEIPDDPGFAPPADDRLEPEQVERFMAVLREVRTATEGRVSRAEERLKALTSPDGDGSAGQVGQALVDLSEGVLDAKRVQVAAVEAQGFSRQEYSWVRRQVYLAAGLGDLSALDFEDVFEAAMEGDLEQAMERAETGRREGPAANVALVEPHAEELREWSFLALLGP